MNHDVILQKGLDGGHLSPAAVEHIQAWLTAPKYEEYRQELQNLIEQEQWQVLNDSFFQVVPFGTGGRRGTVGIGPNRINRITIGESAQGLANYLLETDTASKKEGVVVAHDTRLTSPEFTAVTAGVLAANGFTVYLFDGFRATPELSFAIRHLKAAAGVVISASHNPPPDNGFKVYWRDGGQLVSPHAEKLVEHVAAVTEIKAVDITEARQQGHIQDIGSDIDTAYYDALLQESLTSRRSATIVYSPLHGTGIRSVLPVLEKAGFAQLTVVAEQADPDGNFSNVTNHAPNPENIAANDQATKSAQQSKADIAITTDPDADRLGVITRTDEGTYQFLTGNQIAALIGFFVADQLKQQGRLQPEHFFVKTIVTTDFLNAIAQDFSIRIYDDLLIGFKYVADLIHRYQDEGDQLFLFGGEESHGILKGSYTRDKDAAIAALLIAELTSTLKDQGKTLMWQLNELYRRYGIFWETLHSTYYEGAQGYDTMQTIMAGLRQTPPTTLADHSVISMTDRKTGQIIRPQAGRVLDQLESTRGDVLIFSLSEDNHTRITVRPSGTEPKLKLYTQVHHPIPISITDEDLEFEKNQANATADKLSAAITAYFNRFM